MRLVYNFRPDGKTIGPYLCVSEIIDMHREENGFVYFTDALEQDYITLRSRYGVDQNPRQNESLKKDCEKIATKYWRKARIEEFNELSPEYSIKLEIKNRKHE